MLKLLFAIISISQISFSMDVNANFPKTEIANLKGAVDTVQIECARQNSKSCELFTLYSEDYRQAKENVMFFSDFKEFKDLFNSYMIEKKEQVKQKFKKNNVHAWNRYEEELITGLVAFAFFFPPSIVVTAPIGYTIIGGKYLGKSVSNFSKRVITIRQLKKIKSRVKEFINTGKVKSGSMSIRTRF